VASYPFTMSHAEDGGAGYGDAKVANREIRVWHGATEKGP
jgi:hypothetical protein